MDIHCFGRSAGFTDLDRGACFGFEEREKLHIAIKVGSGHGPEQHDAGVVFWPGRPEYKDFTPGPYGWFDGPLIHFPSARLVASPNLADVKFTYFADEVGIVNSQGRLLLVVKGETVGIKHTIDLASGELVPRPNAPLFYVKSWKIVQPGANSHDTDTICEYPAPV